MNDFFLVLSVILVDFEIIPIEAVSDQIFGRERPEISQVKVG